MALSAHPDNPQMIERHTWRVIYDDDTELAEYPSPTKHNSFDTVEHDRVKLLILEPNPWLEETGASYVVQVTASQRPIMFRTVLLSAWTQESARWHVFGWQDTVNGKNVQSLSYLSNDDPAAPIMQASERLIG